MIRIQLNQEERKQLERFRKQSSSKNSEKALMVLMNADGNSAQIIAQKVKRNAHTVRMWLKRYLAKGIAGLERQQPPGRPRQKRESSNQLIKELLTKSPQEFNYPDAVWSIPLIRHYLQASHGLKVSKDTITRGLKNLGYSYKRPSQTVPPQAPSAEEKKEAKIKMINDIEKLTQDSLCEILFSDESHFSTEPYLIRGWFKKRWPPQDSRFQKKRTLHHVWLLKSKKWAFLLEAIQAG